MTPSNSAAPAAPPRLLIVDDTPANIGVAIDMLATEGFEVQVAISGEDALEVIAKHPPDLVLLDVRMPGIDGFETYRRLRAMQGLEDLPVIFVTAEGDVEMVSQGAAMGGIDYVTKPIQQEVLLASPAWAQPDDKETRQFVILHTNNLESRLLPWRSSDEDAVGGMARTVLPLRGAGDQALILDAGDALGPALLSRYDRGRTMVRLMNRAGYAALVLGNHDLTVGLDSLRARVRQANFSLLAANLTDEENEPIFPPHTIVERQGLRIGIVGLLSPKLAERVHPQEREGLKFQPPRRALDAALDSLEARVDLTVALVHMKYDEVLELARQFPQVNLFVAGGYGSGTSFDEFVHAAQLANGSYVVSTPGSSYIGRIEVAVERREEGWRPGALRAGLMRIGAHSATDDTARQWIEAHQARFRASRAEVIGSLDSTEIDATHFVAEIMQLGARAEAAMINRGALRPLALKGEVQLSSLDSLMRFEDDVVLIRMRGGELQKLFKNSKKLERQAQQLVFAGYDAGKDTINGRPFDKSETFQVATTRFLAFGGDGHLKNKEAVEPPGGRLTLRQLTRKAIRHGGTLPDVRRRGRSTWKTQWETDVSLTLTSMYESGEDDPSENAMAWNGTLEGNISHATPRRSLELEFRTRFGQVLKEGDLRESSDRVDGKLLYTWHRRDPAPFVAIDLNTLWTPRPGRDRPLTVRGSSGLDAELGNLEVRFGLGLERDFVEDETQIGIEVVPEFKLKLFRKIKFDFQTEIFYAATERRLSVENQNKLKIELPGDLKLTANADVCFEWDGPDDRRDLESELQVGLGLGYDWGGKLAR